MDAGISSRSDNNQQGLEALLVEVNGLANRLKSSNIREAIPSASRAVLQVLQRGGPQTVPQIARVRFSSRQNIQIVVNRLQKEGLVNVLENPEHKRSVLIRLTEQGQVAISEASRADAELNSRVLPSFSQADLSSAAGVLNKLRKMLGGKETAESAPSKMIRRKREVANSSPEVSSDFNKGAETVPGTENPEPGGGELPVSLL